MSELFSPNKRLVAALPGWAAHSPPTAGGVIGVLPGEGIGPEVIDAALGIVEVIRQVAGEPFEVRVGGKIGLPAQIESGRPLTPQVIDFCQSVFDDHGAILCGPGGGRFVYDLRAHFDLYCKFTPIRRAAALRNIGVIKPDATAQVDIVIVRENTGGLYFGDSELIEGTERSARHRFEYTEAQVRRILDAALRLARMRHGKLCVVLKPGGVPAISALWERILEELGEPTGVEREVLEVDNAMYQLIANARKFDVVAAPNMFGDILSDGASLLLGSRGMSYSGNFGVAGCAVYQTGHGAARDLAGTNRANPLGQILSLAMLLRESFGSHELAGAIELAIEYALREGWRTADVADAGGKVIGTKEMGARVADHLAVVLDSRAARS